MCKVKLCLVDVDYMIFFEMIEVTLIQTIRANDKQYIITCKDIGHNQTPSKKG